MKAAGVAGPFFVSIGSAEKLTKFLDLNPVVPRDMAFVDSSPQQDGYASVKLRPMFTEGAKTFKADKLKDFDWGTYLSNVSDVAPVDPKSTEFPVGVVKQGGTFVLQGAERILFASADRLPGDEPEVDQVLGAAGA
mmetsp:Transcript_35596/g.83212  ORF Transcript_35596/g.83212 Transcript_35596/m.83212 type:complete len:136 (+) Transcript_35596:1555-1962(+)